MYVTRGGMMYGFCPGKATWDHEARELYNAMVIASRTGALWDGGGLSDQPQWFVDMLGWFLPMYDRVTFAEKVRLVMGDPKAGKVTGSQTQGDED
jgi:hypothetical protein